MAYRNLFIENPASLYIEDRQLKIKTDRLHSVPIEDIATLLIESRQSSVTSAALSALARNNVTVLICDERHLPCAVLLPYMQHSRTLTVIRSQMETPEPLKKRLWQSIVRAKIGNQSRCLELTGKAEALLLRDMVKKVKSGDTGNMEAAAAARYFPALFSDGFTRSNDEELINGALNYGYAILRGQVARCVASYGFLPALGLHHRSSLNAFNLADDLIEPFRPVVDLMVARCEEFHDSGLTPTCKKMLFGCLSMDILCSGQHQSVSYAIELLVKSLSTSLSRGTNELCLPELTELKLHMYE